MFPSLLVFDVSLEYETKVSSKPDQAVAFETL